MAYQIEWEQWGAVTYFTGDVSFDDLRESECEIFLSAAKAKPRFVISVFLRANEVPCSEGEYQELTSLRYGGYASKGGIRFAVVTSSTLMKNRFIADFERFGSDNSAAVFPSFVEAVNWVRS